IILLGIFCYKKQLFTQTQIDGFELLLFNIIIPSYLFAASYKHDLSALLNTQYIAAYLLTFGILALIVTVIFVKKLSTIAVCMRILAASYVNAAIYTLPVITILLKDPTTAMIGNIIQVIIIQPIFIILLNTLKHKEKSLIKKIVSVITTPLIIMPIIGILLNYLKVALPIPIVDAISQIGSGASGLALFAFGLTLGATKITAQCLKFDLLSILFIKNLVHPLVAIFIAYLMKLESYWFNSLIIAASAPTAFVVYMISKEFSTEEELVKKVIALSSVVSILSLILIAIIIG
ncbi:MAG: AEC family transporter, partial [Alphaproteobacteria bacterium]